MVGQFTKPAVGYLVEIFMHTVIFTVLLSDNQRKHITEIHTAVERSGGVEVTEFVPCERGFSRISSVGVLVFITKQNVKPRVLANAGAHT